VAARVFAYGVDAGAELVLRWVEEELTRLQAAHGSLPEALAAVRAQSRRFQQAPFLHHAPSAVSVPGNRP